jgi:hypothetical protein
MPGRADSKADSVTDSHKAVIHEVEETNNHLPQLRGIHASQIRLARQVTAFLVERQNNRDIRLNAPNTSPQPSAVHGEVRVESFGLVCKFAGPSGVQILPPTCMFRQVFSPCEQTSPRRHSLGRGLDITPQALLYVSIHYA